MVDAAFVADTLDANGIVIDIGRAHDALKAMLGPLNYRNLDDIPEFRGQNTTTEFLSKHIYDGLAKAARAGQLGRPGRELKAITRHAFGIARRACVIRGALVVKRVVFAVPGSLDTPTGGYAYDRRIMTELRHLGWEVEYLNIGDGFPAPDEATRRPRALLAAIPAGRPVVLDGLALGALPESRPSLRAGIPWSRWCIIHWRSNAD